MRIACRRPEAPRLRYVLRWVSHALDIQFEARSLDAAENADLIYAPATESQPPHIPDSGLLWEQTIAAQKPAIGSWAGLPTLFAEPRSQSAIPFDVFGAMFYLLSRYEEYTHETVDAHDRFPHTSSILWKQGWLDRPIVDEWLLAFGRWIERRFSFCLRLSRFVYLPTYDIDIAYSILGKGLMRQAGGLLRDACRLDWALGAQKIAVLAGRRADPYDSFDRIAGWHQTLGFRPLFFILAALRTTAFDKNLYPKSPLMQQLIPQLMHIGDIGLHPSYYSQKATVFSKERETLEAATLRPITCSRQHYIRLSLPQTLRTRIEQGIRDEYSMGYANATGFRAGTGRNFYWFDLPRNAETSLSIHPFFLMDTAAKFGRQWQAEQTHDALRKATAIARQTGSRIVTVFHNFSLGQDPAWQGWPEMYAAWLREVGENNLASS